MGLDLDGRTPGDVTGVTGGLTHGRPDANGQRLIHCAQACNLWLPSSTRAPLLHTAKPGAEHRIDYLALGGASICFPTQAPPPKI